MLTFLSKLVDWLKSPTKWFLLLIAVFITSAALLLLPSAAMQKMGLVEIRQHYLPWISLCVIFSSALLFAEFVVWLKTPLQSFREQRDRKAVLLDLTPPEMDIIVDYFRKQTDTQSFRADDGLIGGLEAKHLVYRTTTVSYGLNFSYNPQPWVREIIRRNPAILQAFEVILARKASASS
jgi:hypothetical protein